MTVTEDKTTSEILEGNPFKALASTVSVVAPATLNEGYTFDVPLDGETVAVSVPPGGVKEGEFFLMAAVAKLLSCPTFFNYMMSNL